MAEMGMMNKKDNLYNLTNSWELKAQT